LLQKITIESKTASIKGRSSKEEFGCVGSSDSGII